MRRVGYHEGLTKREFLAACAMQGLLSEGSYDGSESQTGMVAEWAVKHADALIAELEKK